jgi:hypothetical protein
MKPPCLAAREKNERASLVIIGFVHGLFRRNPDGRMYGPARAGCVHRLQGVVMHQGVMIGDEIGFVI